MTTTTIDGGGDDYDDDDENWRNDGSTERAAICWQHFVVVVAGTVVHLGLNRCRCL